MSKYVLSWAKHCKCKIDEGNHQLMSRQAHFSILDRTWLTAFMYVVSVVMAETKDVDCAHGLYIEEMTTRGCG